MTRHSQHSTTTVEFAIIGALRKRSAPALLRPQRGAAMVFVIVGLVALLLAAALALDVGNMERNKTFLQNATDAAALAAAKTLDSTYSTVAATAEARTAFGNNATGSGDNDLVTAWGGGAGSITLTVQYSATLPPFTPGSPTGPYVRVTATGFSRPTWFATLAGINQMTVNASAVSGPSPSEGTSCGDMPMLVCGDTTPGAVNWGFTLNAPMVLKRAAPGGNSPLSPGNFQLLALGGNGANVVRQNIAGGYPGCLSVGDTVTTEPGNVKGPVQQGLAYRFGQSLDPQYPPDVVTTGQTPQLTVVDNGTTQSIYSGSNLITASNIDQKLFSYNSYKNAVATKNYNFTPGPPGTGRFGRRIVTVPVGACPAGKGGKTTLTVIGLACYFLLDMPQGTGNTDWVIGQFIGGCDANGVGGPSPGTGPAPYVIQLYHDPASGDS